MGWLLPLLILASDVPAQDGYAETVYSCGFEHDHDRNYDGWPDHWTRQRGRDYPYYLKVGIEPDTVQPRPEGNAALRMRLDGGAAIAYSPRIKIYSLFSYVLEAEMRTEGLENNEVFIVVSFLDEEGEVLEKHSTEKVTNVANWSRFRVGPVTPKNEKAKYAVISLHVEPTTYADLTGDIWFDNIWFARLPRMIVKANSEFNIYSDPQTVRVECTVSGIGREPPKLAVELRDVEGRLLAKDQLAMEGGTIQVAEKTDRKDLETGFVGKVHWTPPIPGRGYYTIHVGMRTPSGRKLERTLSIVVVDSFENPVDGEFGWSLPRGEDPFSVKTLLPLLSTMGISWVKFPAWYSPQDAEHADRLAWFAERLGANNIEMIGVLDVPPEDVREKFSDSTVPSIAAVFLDPHVWQPVIDPVIVRLSLKVRWWQLGNDSDASFIAYPNLSEKIKSIKKHFDQFGQKTKLGVNWDWLYGEPTNSTPPWAFLSYGESVPFTPGELNAYLEDERPARTERWVTIEPLPKQQYVLDVRARDLVRRMLVAKIGGATGIFITNPFDDETGVMKSDGTPTELLLPFRTTATLISGAKYIGSITMPNGSQNYIFEHNGEALMAVWNDRPTTEKIYLGERLEQVDLWGRRQSVPEMNNGQGHRRQVVDVGPMPVFLTGVHLGITKWRMAFHFDKKQLSSVFGREQLASYSFSNAFPQGVGGRLQLNTPEVWDTNTREISFKLATGDRQSESFRVVLGTDASSGPQRVRIDFDLTADRQYQFSVYRTMEVGLGDVVVELSTRLDESGNLVVEQQVINHTEEFVSFNCLLFAPGRRRLRQQINHLGQGSTTIDFVLPDGAELLGKKLWLRAEEIGGNRLLNYHVDAER